MPAGSLLLSFGPGSAESYSLDGRLFGRVSSGFRPIAGGPFQGHHAVGFLAMHQLAPPLSVSF